jgi:archaellum biogenesis protein FlaJ (TadC family)
VSLKKQYKRLCSGGHLFYRYTLWLGKDHLLYISAGIFVEDYKRFYFRDIQSLIIYKTNYWKVWNIVLACLGAMFLIMAIFFADTEAMIAGIMASLLSSILAFNLIKGPTCAAHIQTAVQKEKLHCMVRIKKAQKIMDSVKPLILSVQRGSS